MEKKILKLPVREMTPALMEKMEKEGLIMRLSPGHDDMLDTPPGVTGDYALY